MNKLCRLWTWIGSRHCLAMVNGEDAAIIKEELSSVELAERERDSDLSVLKIQSNLSREFQKPQAGRIATTPFS